MPIHATAAMIHSTRPTTTSMPPAPEPPPRRVRSDADFVTTIAFAAIVLGVLLLVRAVGVWPGDVIVWPLAAAMAGLALLAMKTAPGGAGAAELPSWPILRRI